jgi:hypothetical protein
MKGEHSWINFIYDDLGDDVGNDIVFNVGDVVHDTINLISPPNNQWNTLMIKFENVHSNVKIGLQPILFC